MTMTPPNSDQPPMPEGLTHLAPRYDITCPICSTSHQVKPSMMMVEFGWNRGGWFCPSCFAHFRLRLEAEPGEPGEMVTGRMVVVGEFESSPPAEGVGKDDGSGSVDPQGGP